MQNIEAVPAAVCCIAGRTDHAGIAGDPRRQTERGRTIGAGQNTGAQNDHRTLGILQHFGKGMAAIGDGGQYRNIRTQLLHPAEAARSTPNHPVARQVEILRDWAHRLDQEGQSLRAAEILDRLLLLAPKDVTTLAYLAGFFRSQGMAEEMAAVAERWSKVEPDRVEAKLRHGEALLRLGRAQEARAMFELVLKVHPVHLLAHLGMAQALGLLGGNPFPHLDAAQELDPAATASVLRETFDYRLLMSPSGDGNHGLEDLPALLGVSGAEVQDYLHFLGLPLAGPEGTVRESELARWVGVMNRYALLPGGLNWSAPTPRRLPELG